MKVGCTILGVTLHQPFRTQIARYGKQVPNQRTHDPPHLFPPAAAASPPLSPSTGTSLPASELLRIAHDLDTPPDQTGGTASPAADGAAGSDGDGSSSGSSGGGSSGSSGKPRNREERDGPGGSEGLPKRRGVKRAGGGGEEGGGGGSSPGGGKEKPSRSASGASFARPTPPKRPKISLDLDDLDSDDDDDDSSDEE